MIHVMHSSGHSSYELLRQPDAIRPVIMHINSIGIVNSKLMYTTHTDLPYYRLCIADCHIALDWSHCIKRGSDVVHGRRLMDAYIGDQHKLKM